MADTQAPLLRRSAPEAPGAASRTSGVRAHRFFFFQQIPIINTCDIFCYVAAYPDPRNPPPRIPRHPGALCKALLPRGVRGPHGPPSGAEAGRSRRGGCEAGMGHGAPRLKQGRSWGLSSGRAGVTAAIGAACKLAPHDHDQPAERCQRGQCGPPL